jgi:hypothetical protein
MCPLPYAGEGYSVLQQKLMGEGVQLPLTHQHFVLKSSAALSHRGERAQQQPPQ